MPLIQLSHHPHSLLPHIFFHLVYFGEIIIRKLYLLTSIGLAARFVGQILFFEDVVGVDVLVLLLILFWRKPRIVLRLLNVGVEHGIFKIIKWRYKIKNIKKINCG